MSPQTNGGPEREQLGASHNNTETSVSDRQPSPRPWPRDRLLLSRDKAEELVIGAALVGRELPRLTITADMFTDTANATIWQTITEMKAAGDPIDAALVNGRVDQGPILASHEVDYLAQLAVSAPITAEDARTAAVSLIAAGGDDEIRRSAQRLAQQIADGQDYRQEWDDLAEAYAVRQQLDTLALGAQAVYPSDAPWWNDRPILAHIRQFALSRRVSPAAVLGVVLMRALASVPPNVVLPPLVGSYGSLNLFCALVARSGGGKSAAMAAARDAVELPGLPFGTVKPGSGEGLSRSYAHRETQKAEDGKPESVVVWDHRSILFSLSEVDGLAAQASRTGSTLMTELRSAYTGEALGFGYADPAKRVPVDAHRYRFALVLGVQPEKSGWILGDGEGGTPQRFLWMPATDPGIPRVRPVEPGPWTVPPLPWYERAEPLDTIDYASAPRHEMGLPDQVMLEIDSVLLANAHGQVNALDGHAMFTREKVAAALAILDGRMDIDMSDWELSGSIMGLSDITRAGIIRTLAERDRATKRRHADDVAEARTAAADRQHDKAVQRVADRLVKHLGTVTHPMSRRDLWTWTAQRDRRPYFDDAINRLIESGQIESMTADGSTYYRLTP